MNQDQILLDFKEGKCSAEEVVALLRQARSLESPLSENQHGLWLLQELEPASTAYNVPFCVRLNASLDTQKFKSACEVIRKRHPVLNGTIAMKDGVPVQSFRDSRNRLEQGISFRHRDASHLDEEQLSVWLKEEATVPFKLAEGPLIRFVVFTTAPDRHVLLFVAHHIVFDGVSTFVFLSELFQIYESLVQRRPHGLKPLQASYGDFVSWERRFLQSPEGDVSRRYWLGQLSGSLPGLTLPIERAEQRAVANGKSHTRKLDDALTAQLRNFCRSSASDRGISYSVVFLGIFQLLLHKYTGERDIIVGMPVEGRPKTEFESLIGYFVNMIAIRSSIDNQQPTRDFLVALDQRLIDGLEHSAYPFARLVGGLGISSAEERDPVFQVAFAFQSGNLARSSVARKASRLLDKLEIVEAVQQRGEFKLSLEILESRDGFIVNVKYDANRFADSQIAAFGGHYLNLLESVLRNPQRKLYQHSALSAAEYLQVVHDWNDTGFAYPQDKCLHELFTEQVTRTPGAVAASYEDEQLTYAQLDRRANQLAHYLIERGVKPDTVVGLCVERSLEMLVGLLGILKAGGAYVPLDPNYPAERIEYMLADCGTPVLLTQQALVGQLPAFKGEVICLDSGWEAIARQSDGAPNVEVAAHHLAYVIYTSGSTGAPKGVMNQHDGIVNRLLWMQDQYGLNASDVILQKTSFSFDVSVWEFFWPLLSGASVVFAKPEGHKDDQYLIELIKRHQVSTMHFVPSMLSVMLAVRGFSECTSLKRVFCSGEALAVEHVRQFNECLPATELHNLYGPTEAAVDVSYWPCVYHPGLRTVPIGKPVANTQLYVLDEQLQPVPIGVGGELYIGGVQLARGYLNKDELTAKSFIVNPLPDTPGARLYKTGDVVRWLADGNIEYLGRRDHQVKIRGFRIELGEIEARVLKFAGVKSCVVLAREDVPGDKRLVAYYTQGESEAVQVEALRDALRNSLPDYMVPSAYVLLAGIPLTPNGKVDRKALPAPDTDAYGRVAYEAPQGPIEERLAGIWQELLHVDRISRQADFFELGGHSLLATSVMSQVRESFGVELALRTLFEHATLSAFAAAIASTTDQHLVLTDVPLVVVDRGQELPLSYSQQRLWFLAQLEQSSANYNVPLALQLKGRLNRAALLRSIEAIVDRHEVLRTRFVQGAFGVAQQISPPGQFHAQVEQYDSSQGTIAQLCEAEARREFELSRDSLIRARLVQVAEEDHVLLVTIHHSVTDGWSMTVFFRELVALYEAYEAGRASPLAPLKIQYADFAHWQRQWLSGDVLAVQQAYWREQLTGIEPVLALPTDRPRPAIKTYAGAVQRFRFSAVLQVQLNQLSQAQGVTLYMTLLAGFQVLLSRYSNQTDIAVGSPIANRPRAELEELIGFFVNTLVMRTDLSGSPTFVELLQRVKQVALGAYAHQDLPFEQLVELLQPQRSLSYTPFFQVMFTLQNLPSLAGRATQMEIVPIEQASRAAKFDLSVSLSQSEHGLQGEVEYNSDLFDAGSIERLIRHYEQLLSAIVAAPQGKIDCYDLLSGAERHQLLVQWNDTAAAYPQDKCLHELFAEQVERTPNAVAVSYEDEQLTYAQLDRKANQLAHYLIERGVKPDTVVGLCLERSLEMIVGLLGIIKAGGAYVPLDPNYPAERIEYMLADCGTPVLLTQQALVGQLPAFKGEVICLDSGWEAIARQGDGAPSVAVAAHHLAYVIYTSGSTGAPKGVMVEHANVVRLFAATQAWFQFDHRDVWTLFHSLAFDFSVWELWGALLYGGRLVVVPYETARAPDDFYRLLCEQSVTILNQTPSAFRQFIAAQVRSTQSHALRQVIFGGEALEMHTLRPWYERNPPHQPQLVNMYGITETTVHVTYRALEPQDTERYAGASPIGVRIPDLRTYILDGHRQPTPIGVVGEIYVAGAGLARGYLNRPELTAERFLPDPFSADPAARIYKSGDLGCYRPDGTIEYFGRNDHQVKIRGFRIELGEIESRLAGFEQIKDAIVIAREDVPGEKRLVAYYTLSGAEVPRVEQLRAYLKSRLPEHMIPSAFVQIDSIPLTANGKLDRKALPAPDGSALSLKLYEAPLGETEARLAAIWQSLLAVERVGRHDNFFELGGHSLLATSVLSQVRQSFSVELPLRTLFEHTTLGTFAAAIASAVDQRSVLREVPLVVLDRTQELPLSYAQQRLWFLAQLERSSANYNVPLALQLKGRLNPAALLRSIETIVDRHEVLRTRFVESAAGVAQQIRPPGEFHVIVEQHDSTRATIAEMCAAEASHEFDLSAESLIRVRLLQLVPEEHVLLITIHHSVTDGWSMSVFFRELVALYEAYEAGRASPLAPLKIQYADFAHWQRQWLSGEVLKGQQGYWREQLAGIEPVLALPTDRARPAVKTYAGAVQRFQFSKALLAQLNQLSQAQGVTLYMTLLAGFQVLLSRYSNQTDIAVGSPIANRPRAELEELIGFFVNTLVMRTDLSGSPSFVELLQRVKQVALGAYAHQDLPFEQLVELLQPQRSLSYTPFFQVMFTLQNLPSLAVSASDMTISPLEQASRAAKFDLSVSMFESEQGLQGEVEYNSDLFDAPTLERLVRHYERLLTAIIAAPAEKISHYDLLSAAERQQLLVEWNDTACAYPRDKCLQELFAEQVERTPQAIAVEYEGEALSYRALNERANQLAHYLIERGVKPDTVVGLCLERSLEMIVGLLGIIKAGGAYAPLDPNYPAERIEYMLQDCGAPLVLSQQALVEKFKASSVEWLALDNREVHARHMARQPTTNISRAQLGSTPEHLVHVIYTSGSTGAPKGVMVEQRGVVRLVCGTNFVELNAQVVMLQQTTLGFDVSAFEIWGALLNGGRLVVYGGDVMDIPRMMATVSRTGVNTIALTPSLLQVWLDQYAQATPSVKTLVVAGEALAVASVVRMYRLNPQLQIIDAYGPTENSVYSVAYRVPKTIQSGDIKPIGLPIAQSSAYVVDAQQRLVPVGCVGELYVGGAGVARGYLNQPQLTAEKFIKDPFSDQAGARLYRSGDLVRRLADGNIEYLGRRDHQVKIRGFRIELGEIEARLLKFAGVQSCVVLAREDVPGDKRLVAYYTQGEQPVEVEALRSALRSGLPDYMVPSGYVLLEAIPMTPNGKIDRRALPAPDADAYGRMAYEAPQGEIEEAIAKVWQELLHVDQVGRHDNFFELGGHSLLAMQFMAQIRATLALELQLKTLFERPTVERFAASVDVLLTAREQLADLHRESNDERQVGAL